MPIAITMGDACGVGPEIALRSWLDGTISDGDILIGDVSVLQLCAEILNLDIKFNIIQEISQTSGSFLNVLDCALLSQKDVTIGKISQIAGKASLDYVKKAVEYALAKKIDALVTLPINKEAIRLTFPGFAGHTGYLAEKSRCRDYCMMLATDKLVATHVSAHVSLKEAVESLNSERIFSVIQKTNRVIQNLKNTARIAVAGLNPHAGESGAFGDEEANIIKPAVDAASKSGIDVVGPVSPDTVFYQALQGKYDAVVCMYHDQGHIPMKLLYFESGVNVTLGLPFIRTSVDHGTAFDIAYQGIASTGSLKNAVKMAKKLAAINSIP